MGIHSTLEDRFTHLVLFDTETTGIDPVREEIIEIGAVSVTAGEEDGSFNALLRLSQGRTLPPFITELTGITGEQLERDGVEKAAAAESFCKLLTGKDTLLVAYNAQFDLNFIYYLLKKQGQAACLRNLKFLDALTVYKDRRDYPHKLKDAIAAYGLEDQVENSHRAVDDARAMTALLWAMAEEKDDLTEYVNLFGYHPKYGVSGKRISSVTYLPQGFQRSAPLYDRARGGDGTAWSTRAVL
ncbi:putative DNA polymerase III epsilon subunit [Oscillibacter valericigenes Sjm18-20]|nr:putative DNA polymerase III epsilon subunit [Oscillibacter valericigenes Sjm18-20]